MDLEGFVRRRIIKGYDEKKIIAELKEVIKEFKDWGEELSERFSKAVFNEVSTSLKVEKIKDGFLREVLSYPRAKVKMGEFGVGSRGEGDFFVHEKIAEIIGKTKALVDATMLDDAGVVKGGEYIAIAIDGMHSRLSEFPFLAGFHCARAALRDIYVMGALPKAMISDLHLGDDGDIGKLFDFTSGVATVGELTSTPLVSGSTLRIGGDMVFGDRLVAAVGAVGIANKKPTLRKNAREGDVILLTEGKGGGTISTIAIYNNYFDVVKITLNVDFARICNMIIEKNFVSKVNAMSDVTNGGLRGDAWEISRVSGKKLVFYDGLEKTVNENVLKMLNELNIDYLGISTESLLFIVPEEHAEELKKYLKRITKIYEVGYVDKGKGVVLGDEKLEVKFRESPYTPIKKVIGDFSPMDKEEKIKDIERAKEEAIKKKKEVIKFIGGCINGN